MVPAKGKCHFSRASKERGRENTYVDEVKIAWIVRSGSLWLIPIDIGSDQSHKVEKIGKNREMSK